MKKKAHIDLNWVRFISPRVKGSQVCYMAGPRALMFEAADIKGYVAYAPLTTGSHFHKGEIRSMTI
jgi:hypothetical protein